MKKLLFFILLLLASVCRAQTGDVYYREGEQTVTVDGMTLEVNRWENTTVIMKTANSKWLPETQWYYADSGLPLTTDAEYEMVKYRLEDPNGHIRAMKEVFTDEEIATLSHEVYAPLTLMCAFDAAGDLQEVEFVFAAKLLLVQVSPERYVRLIKLLKERLKLIYEPDSLKVQFVAVHVFVHFKDWDKMPPDPLNRPDRPENPDRPRPGE